MSKRTNELGTAVVTGASSGLGVVFAERLAQRGYDLVLVARRADRLETLATKLRETYGVQVANLVADLGDMAGLEKAADAIKNDASITMLVNNAGTTTMALSTATPVDKQLAMINLNVTAVTILTNAVLPGLIARDHGTVINVGSVMGFHSLAFTSIYSGTKSYVEGFTRGLQEELKDTKVVVQLLAPASTATEIWEVGGYPLSALDPAIVMTIEDCVDAALSGLAQGELFTLPSVENKQLQDEYEQARLKLFAASQVSGRPASRYKLN